MKAEMSATRSDKTLRRGRARRTRALNHGSSHVTPTGRNLFLYLGFSSEEAENLRIRSLLMIALSRLIADIPQREAAMILGTTEPRVNRLARGGIDLLTIDSLVNKLAHAGMRVRISVAPRVVL